MSSLAGALIPPELSLGTVQAPEAFQSDVEMKPGVSQTEQEDAEMADLFGNDGDGDETKPEE